MTTLDLAPAPGAAAPTRRVLGHALIETRLLLRNGEQLLLALVIPAAILILGPLLGGTVGDLTTLAPSVLALAVWSSAFTSLAIATGFERRYGVLERLAATPLGRDGLLTGKALSVAIVCGLQLVVLSALALSLGWRPSWTPLSLAAALLALTLAGGAFSGLALALAGRLRAEATLGLANVIYVVLLAGGGLVVPIARYPEAIQPVLRLLPTGALGEAVRAGAVGLTLVWPLVVLTCWLMLAGLSAWRSFRWTS